MIDYQKLPYDLNVKIASYLDFESLVCLSQTNRNQHRICKKIMNDHPFHILSKRSLYICKDYKSHMYDYFFWKLFVKVIYFNEQHVHIQYIPFGRNGRVLWPIQNIGVRLFSHDITHPVIKDQYIKIDDFYKTYKIYNYPWSARIHTIAYMICKSIFIYGFIYIPILIILALINIIYYLFYPVVYTIYFGLLFYFLQRTIQSFIHFDFDIPAYLDHSMIL